ncbi:hypothetical protein [Streptomyces sp. NPDC001537]
MSFDLETEQTRQGEDYEALVGETMRELATNEPNDDLGLLDGTLDEDTLTTAWFIVGFEAVGGQDVASAE